MTMASQFVRVQAPNVPPRPFGLFSVAPPITPPDTHWSVGVMFDPLGCLLTSVWLDPCVVGGAGGTKVVTDCSTALSRQFNPFTVYAGIKRTGAFGDVPVLARAVLANGESFGVETYLWDQFVAAGLTPVAGGSPVGALAAVEQNLAANYMGQGVIHVSPSVATQLGATGLISGNNKLTTVIGTPVVVGAGYDTPVKTIFGSGQVAVFRGGIEEIEGRDKTVNDYVAMAERTYVVGWDCYLTSANFP